MKYIYIIISFLFFISCSQNQRETRKLNQSQLNLQLTNNYNTKILVNPNFNSFQSIFDTLSLLKKNEYIKEYKKEINSKVLVNYNNYSKIKDIDTVFDILVSSRIDSIKNIKLLPFYVYILNRSSNNKNLDGYIGEFISDMYYAFFINYPGYFYQYLKYKEKTNKNDLRDILYQITNNLDATEIKDIDIKLIFKKQREKMKDNISIINTTEDFIMKNTDEK
jgi:hypothetical protein